MKKKYILQTLVILFIAFTANAQQGINYKAIIADANGDALVNTAITVQFTILENGTTEVYKETHNPTTDVNGIIIVNIGEGSVISGDFDNINWGGNPHFLKTEIDKGEGLTDMGTTEFKTVPYALYAKTSSNTIDFSNFEEGDILQFNGNSLEPATFSIYYLDNDDDGYGSIDALVYSPVKPPDFITISGDTNDNNPDINPGIDEVCGDGIDNNSDGQIDEGCVIGDVDCDGFTVENGDCNDNDITIYPGAVDILDSKDNDCDGMVDEGLIPAGALIITEIMYDPNAVPDLSGEWIEITNVWTDIVNLNSFSIRDNSTDYHVINKPSGILLAPGESVVLGSDADFSLNGGVYCDYEWSSFQLGNTNDEIIIEHYGFEIDRVEYNEVSWPTASGKSLSLDPNAYNATSNLDGANWCNSPDMLSSGDYGSPGNINPSCLGSTVMNIISVTPNTGIDAGGESITIIGSGFTQATDVKIGLVSCSSFTVIDNSHIDCVTPAQLGGDYDVSVTKDGESAILDNGYRYSTDDSHISWGELHFPLTLSANVGVPTTYIYGRVYIPGISSYPTENEAIAQIGFGPQGSDPKTTPGWLWYRAQWNPECLDCEQKDEFKGNLTFLSNGTFSYTFRFSDDGGSSFIYSDYIPGTSNGFSTTDLGTVIVE